MLSKTQIKSSGIIATAGLMALALAAPLAHADKEIEVGGFLGIHAFSENNEIGVADLPGGTGPNGEALADALSPANSAILGARVAYAVSPMFSLEGELGFLPAKVRESTAELLTVVYRIHVMAHFAKIDEKLRPFAVLGVGGMSISSSEPGTVADDTDFVVHGGVGFKYAMAPNWGLRFDARALLPPSSDSESITTEVEATVGLYTLLPYKKVPPPPKDQDGDGLTDDVDQCPAEAEDKDSFQDDDGCPDKDNDADGIPDETDKCKNDAEDKDSFQDDDGCPDTDNDGDGVLDANDKCPLEAEDKDGFEDENGCPDPDNDNDQLLDAQDKCPNDAEDKDGFQDEDGCPDPDNDGDGVLDAQDKCPAEQETKNGFQDDDGCPDVVPKALKRFTGAIKGINFESGKDVIRKSSFKTLDKAIKVMQDFPDTRIEISGHTDDVGNDDDNMKLSQARADAVVKYMVDKGIAANRLEAKGFGETRPSSPLTDDKGKELKGWKLKKARGANRRVEFKLLSALTAEPAAAPAPTPAPAPAP